MVTQTSTIFFRKPIAFKAELLPSPIRERTHSAIFSKTDRFQSGTPAPTKQELKPDDAVAPLSCARIRIDLLERAGLTPRTSAPLGGETPASEATGTAQRFYSRGDEPHGPVSAIFSTISRTRLPTPDHRAKPSSIF
jgi:hypothetical protein